MRKLFQNFRSEESGATLVEYGVALIIAILVGGGALIAISDEVVENMETTAGVQAFTDGDAVVAQP